MKNVLFIVCALFLLLGCVEKVNVNPDQYIVPNPDIETPLPECRFANAHQACVLYLKNTSQHTKKGEDFFDEASHLRNVPKYPILMVNIRYATQSIPAGYTAKIKIPSYGK